MFRLQQFWTRITVNAAEDEDEVVREAISVVEEFSEEAAPQWRSKRHRRSDSVVPS